MRITTWAEYSLIISMHLAKRARAGQGPVAARDLAEIEKLPADYVEQILLRLRRAGLVESVRGARGGYFMTKDTREISMRDIMAASERQTFEMNCEAHPVGEERCQPSSACSIRPVWVAIQRTVDDLLGRVTLADLLDQEPHVQELVTLGHAQ
ncbi:MAG TPA: Rrf2 family transcriptional regulator [Gemmatimonadales bacterium]|nr:Rrf2 family transcriptional regulator [Gemmatimonadales bacterium]